MPAERRADADACPFAGQVFFALPGRMFCAAATNSRSVIIAFRAVLYYNRDMNITRIVQAGELPAAEEFEFSDKTVQGAKLGKRENMLYVVSPRRFKLFADKADTLTFLAGSGHFKWARGEKDFAAGETFRIEGEGEYEVNGNCTFIAVRE